jgi:hypothetical protein
MHTDWAGKIFPRSHFELKKRPATLFFWNFSRTEAEHVQSEKKLGSEG